MSFSERTGPQCLLGDLGGTNIRLTLVPASRLTGDHTLPPMTHHTRYRTAEFEHLHGALARFMREKPDDIGRVEACVICVCGPVSNGRAICLAESMGPDGWVLDEAEVAAALGLGERPHRVRLLNDFIAVGLAVGETDWRTRPHQLTTVHEGSHSVDGTIAVLGPGTGLGSCFGVRPSAPAALAPSEPMPSRARVQIYPSEGGESDFVARTDTEWALRAYLQRELGVEHVKVEHVVSGLGLARIYAFLRHSEESKAGEAAEASAAEAAADAAAVQSEVEAAPEPSVVVASRGTAGEGHSDPHCVAAVEMFLEALGAEAANLALRFQAHGGVYIAGGVTAKLAERLVSGGRLCAAYLGKGRSTDAYRACPLYLLAVEGDDLAYEGTWRFARRELRLGDHLPNGQAGQAASLATPGT